jgi:Uma2 family endonuclease
MTARIAWTYEDYAALPNDGKRYEIHAGELVVTPAPASDHQVVLMRLLRVLDRHVEAHGLGLVLPAPLDVILTEDPRETTVVEPDIVHLAVDRLPALRRRGVVGPPTLVIEILSPGTAATDRGTKRGLYARHGVPHYWIVDLDRRVLESYVLRGSDYQSAVRASGSAPVDVPPFVDLGLVPDSLWPPFPILP